MPWRDTTIMDEKVAFINEFLSGVWTITELCKHFGISRPLGYKYIKRYQNLGFAGLNEMPRKPLKSPNKTPDIVIEHIKTIKKQHKRFGAEKIHVKLAEKYPKDKLPGISTINVILKKAGLVKSRKNRRKFLPENPVFESKEPNDIWSADFKGKFRLGDMQYLTPLTIMDSYSCFILSAYGLYHSTFEETQSVFEKVFKEYGLPQKIHTDNGCPFAGANSLARLSSLAVWFLELGIDPVYSDPGHPEQNGRHERMHKELKAEVARPPSANRIWQQRRLNRFIHEYNYERPHKALGNLTPSTVYKSSPRQFPTRILHWEYPKEYSVKRVYHNSCIRWGSDKWVMVATPLMDKEIGMEELGEGIWRVYFRNKLLGYLDEKSLRIKDIERRTKFTGKEKV